MGNASERTPSEWCVVTEVKILDPDGWDRRNFDEDWARPITFDEFKSKALMSTIDARTWPPMGYGDWS